MIMLLAVVGLTVGVALGLAFRAFVLLPTSPIVVVVATSASLLKGHDMVATLLGAAAIVAALQLGYVLGLVSGPLRLRSPSPVRSSSRNRAQGYARQPWAAGDNRAFSSEPRFASVRRARARR